VPAAAAAATADTTALTFAAYTRWSRARLVPLSPAGEPQRCRRTRPCTCSGARTRTPLRRRRSPPADGHMSSAARCALGELHRLAVPRHRRARHSLRRGPEIVAQDWTANALARHVGWAPREARSMPSATTGCWPSDLSAGWLHGPRRGGAGPRAGRQRTRQDTARPFLKKSPFRAAHKIALSSRRLKVAVVSLCRPFGAPRGNDGAPGSAWRRGGRLPPPDPGPGASMCGPWRCPGAMSARSKGVSVYGARSYW
jgi:hypothetical protein